MIITGVKIMPYPNEHAGRVKDPADFINTSFRRKVVATGVSIITGKLKADGNDGSMITQAYRFNIDYFTADEAKEWLKNHDIEVISFEPAINENSNVDQSENRSNLIIENRFICNNGYEFRIAYDDNGDSEKFVSGTGIVYNSKTELIDGYFESIAAGAFTRSLNKFNTIKSFINHDPSKILSTTRSEPALEIFDNDDELYFISPIPPTTYGTDLIENLKRKNINGASFSFTVSDGGEEYKINKDGSIHRIITSAEIYEVGPVTNPAYEQTEVNLRSKDQFRDIRDTILKKHSIDTQKDLLEIKQFLKSRKERYL